MRAKGKMIMTHANTILKLSGLGCAACASKVEDVLNSLPGVISVSVNLEESVASVEYDPASVDLDIMIAAVKEVGYGAGPSV